VEDQHFTHISDHYGQVVTMEISDFEMDGADAGPLSHAFISIGTA